MPTHPSDEKRVLRSFSDLSVAERKKVWLIALSIGFLVALIYLELFVLCYGLPDKTDPFAFDVMWSIALGGAFVLFGLTLLFAFDLMVSDLGYHLPTHVYEGIEHQVSTPAFSTPPTQILQAYSFETPMSINPASGLPMSGGSRMDTSGNPYGSNSW